MKLNELTVSNNEKIVWGKRTYLMGIINITPDSFSGDGIFEDIIGATKQAELFESQGVDFIDIGAESTRPLHHPINMDEELSRIVPVVEAITKAVSIPISIDTTKAKVAEECLKVGAHIINDISGLNADSNMAKVVSSANCPIIIMHNKKKPVYTDLLLEIRNKLQENIRIAVKNRIDPSNIIIDPGFGFGKTPDDNLQILNNLEMINPGKFPILLGTSRKSTIGHILNSPVESRIEGTSATVSIGISRGADIVRVHDVYQMKQISMMTDAIVRGWRPEHWNNP
jgi:dihydropteroate synthase